MVTGLASTQQLLEREAQAWRDLPPAEYDRAVCGMLDDVGAAPHSPERVDALLALAGATLRRNGPTLTESPACCAERLLALGSAVSEPALHWRIGMLFLLAWLQLGAAVERGPESISVAPALPPGVALPNGVDPAAIADPALREQAREDVQRHREAAERWNAKQRALGHLTRLATLARASRGAFGDDGDAARELAAAMSLVSGLSAARRRLLQDDDAD